MMREGWRSWFSKLFAFQLQQSNFIFKLQKAFLESKAHICPHHIEFKMKCLIRATQPKSFDFNELLQFLGIRLKNLCGNDFTVFTQHSINSLVWRMLSSSRSISKDFLRKAFNKTHNHHSLSEIWSPFQGFSEKFAIKSQPRLHSRESFCSA